MKDKLDHLCKRIPLKTRIQVNSQMAFINLLTELDYRESKMWTPDEDELLNKVIKLANEQSDHLIEEFKQWEADGRPE